MTINRTRLPEPGPSSSVSFPAIEKSALSNGLGVWTVRHSQIPVVALMLLVRRGAADDPAGKHGLAALTADMLDEGVGTLSAIELHEAIARMGTQLEADIGSDAALIGFSVLRRFSDRAMDLLADIVVSPALREDDFDRVRQLRLHRLTQLRDAPGAIADRTFIHLLYGEHPYGHTPIGNELALAGLTVDDVRACHARLIRPASATLIAVGDCHHDEIHRLAASAFDRWGARSGADDGADQAGLVATLPSPARLNVIPRPAAPQSELRIGHVAVARNTPDYHALIVGNMILGGQFVSRINLNLREDKGFTYGARTGFDFRRRPGPFALHAGVQTDATAQAIQESISEISAIRGPRPVTREELDLAIAGLTRGYARNFETAEQIARGVTQLALYDLPDDYFAQFVSQVERVTTDEVTRVMSRHIDPSKLTTIVVGDIDTVGAGLGALGLGDPVILSAETF